MVFRRERDLTLVSHDSEDLQLCFGEIQTLHVKGNSLSFKTRNIWEKEIIIHTLLGQRMTRLFNFQSE